MRYVLDHKSEAIISQMKHRRKIIKYVECIMFLYTIHIQLRSRLHKYYKIRISREKSHRNQFLRDVTKWHYNSQNYK
jgi:hypothetical protein